MLCKNVSRAFDAYIIRDLFNNMMFDAFKTNNIDYKDAKEYLEYVDDEISEWAWSIIHFNNAVLDNNEPQEIINARHAHISETANAIYYEMTEYFYHNDIDVELDMRLYSIISDITDCVLTIVVTSRCRNFTTK